jgi:hypothetical protein
MKAGFQTAGISYWEHGELVAARFRDLMNPNPNMTWRLPAWFEQNADWIRAKLAPDFELISSYQLWHDLSKPLCKALDADGRTHYPNHATIGEQTWLALGGDKQIGRLIGRDMDMHTMKPSAVQEYQHLDVALVLLTTALCELHANSSMFGGFGSDSFKIKFKNLDRLGSAFFRVYGAQGLVTMQAGEELNDSKVGGLL